MKHYAYHNMSRRTQLTTKFIFQVMAQLSENFIFIYLGLSLFTESSLEYKPLFILITVVGICVARWCAVFPLSRLINWFIRYRARRRGQPDAAEELPYSYQAMLFWAGLRGAVGVALAAGLTGENGFALRATVLVVVVLTVIIFGGTTARMLEILGIRTGVVEEIDSDDEFDIEVVNPSVGVYARKAGAGFGHNPKLSQGGGGGNGNFALPDLDLDRVTYSSGSINGNGTSPPTRPNGIASRRSSTRLSTGVPGQQGQGLLNPDDFGSLSDNDDDLDLPPSARRSPMHTPGGAATPTVYPTTGRRSGTATPSAEFPLGFGGMGMAGTPQGGAATGGSGGGSRIGAATGAIGQLISGLTEDPAGAFRSIDERFIKPNLLLDPQGGGGKGHGPGNV